MSNKVEDLEATSKLAVEEASEKIEMPEFVALASIGLVALAAVASMFKN